MYHPTEKTPVWAALSFVPLILFVGLVGVLMGGLEGSVMFEPPFLLFWRAGLLHRPTPRRR